MNDVIAVRGDLGLPGIVTRVGLDLPTDLDFSAWSEIGNTLRGVEGAIQWWIGDWLNFGEKKYGETYSQAIDATEYTYQSLADAKWVSEKFGFSDRSENLSWTHHRVAAGTPDPGALLSLAEQNGWSVRELRNEVNKRKAAKRLGSPTSEDGTCTVADLLALIERGVKFSTIYADPPWLYDNQATRASTENHYGGMTIAELCDLPIRDLVTDDGHLHLWTTNAFLFECPKIFDAWGFEFRSSYVWTKPQMGIGNYWRNSHEILLTAIRGDAKRFNDHSLMSWGSFDRGPLRRHFQG
ncbi:MT-A70 family methyltransferase [Bradyrhizobium elkanii]|uniref:MT-A70 family methyltransferase n=1 Tax=Bradyrhizobium elkanii TaxID=29448 RepID=UPI002226F9F4|nr:MT-A70 family methyltransferase [Bradyrhizobium elkanii]MCW2226998.1 hypothetical protein [Bradyrhizobium elkanii]